MYCPNTNCSTTYQNMTSSKTSAQLKNCVTCGTPLVEKADTGVIDLVKSGSKATLDSLESAHPTPDTKALRKELFRIIEPAIFNNQDNLYLDRALADLETLFTSKLLSELEALSNQRVLAGNMTEYIEVQTILDRITQIKKGGL